MQVQLPVRVRQGGASFGTREEFSSRREVGTSSNNYMAEITAFSFINRQAILSYLRSSREKDLLICSLCPTSHPRHLLHLHLEQVHPEHLLSLPDTFRCEQCNYSSDDSALLALHLVGQQHHFLSGWVPVENLPQLMDEEQECDLCGGLFRTR